MELFPQKAEPDKSRQSKSESTSFILAASGLWRNTDGREVSWQRYRANDGTSAWSCIEIHDSEVDVLRAYRSRLEKAKRVIENGKARMKGGGGRIESRAVTSELSEDGHREITFVVWTHGSHLHYVYSSSRKHAQALEEHMLDPSSNAQEGKR